MNRINLILSICNIAIKAGQIINEYYLKDHEVYYKKDSSPLTKADIDSNNFIIKSLNKLDSSIPVLSEESFVDWNVRKKWIKYWLIDPLDGTKEFINKNNEFTVNIALIEKNKPILGIIYAPALFELFYASIGNGSFKILTSKSIDSISNAKKIIANIKTNTDYLKIIGSRSHNNDEFTKWIKNNIKDYEIIKKGSSLKFCALAEGLADLYPRFGPTSEWDIAAGHIILKEAGGKMQSIENNKIFYNTKESVINPKFIATCNYIKEKVE